MIQVFSELCDPAKGMPMTFENDRLIARDGTCYPIINGIPRFVSERNYAADFGKQWQAFKKTQLDSCSGLSISRDRLMRCLNGHLNLLEGKIILEAGSGAGRFTELLLTAGAIVHSFDLSSAVEANHDNNGHSKNLTLVQADICHMPFQRSYYDYVICLGVLQHTPSPEESIRHLYQMVRSGGYLVIDHYIFKWRNVLPPPIGGASMIYRRLLLALPSKYRFSILKRVVNFWFPIHWYFKDSKFLQRILRRLSPVHFYYSNLDLKTKDRYYQWALLDTHDSTTDYYKHHRSAKQIRLCLERLGAKDIVVTQGGNGVEAFCRKP